MPLASFIVQPSDRPGRLWAIVAVLTGEPVAHCDGDLAEAHRHAARFERSLWRLMGGLDPDWPS
jgi:hypothetical protein